MRIPDLTSVAALLALGLAAASSLIGGTEADKAVRAGWFPFAPQQSVEPGAIGMADWLDAPAGRHGVLMEKGDALVFADGTPVKFWGTNHGNGPEEVVPILAPAREEAVRRAAWYARQGINIIRFHRFPWDESEPAAGRTSTRIDARAQDGIDFYSDTLKRQGIYYTWSHIFGLQPLEGDRSRLLAFDEVMLPGSKNFLVGTSTYGIVNLFEDLQALSIERTVRMLEHRNLYSGLRYADEPALAMIELQNEDNAWWTAEASLKKMPTYRAKLAGLFCDWLRAKYGSEEKLLEAWGPRGLNLWPELATDERLARNNIYPPADRQYYQPEKLAASPSRQRLLDCAQFLHERQCDFYRRYAAAIRATGYKGCLIASNWIAENGLPHYLNLKSDAEIGMIDRHIYFGAENYHMPVGKRFGNTASMVTRDDLGLLRVALDQVKDRPFAISEWTSLVPNEWVAEGPAVVAFYGLGLQGWDASFHFASNHAGFSDQLESPNVYNTNSPTQGGLFPLLARAVLRGDVTEGRPFQPQREISDEDLRQGSFGYIENSDTDRDAEFAGRVALPLSALASGKVEIAFTGQIPAARLEPQGDRSGGAVTSNTGELVHDAKAGHFTVSTHGTKAFVGRNAAGVVELEDLKFRVVTPFSVIVVTDAEKAGDLRKSGRVLIGTMGRAENTGMRFNASRDTLEALGGPPILLEGIVFELTWKRLRGATIRVLDHDGLRTDRVIPVESDGVAHFDGARDRAFLYEVTWP